MPTSKEIGCGGAGGITVFDKKTEGTAAVGGLKNGFYQGISSFTIAYKNF
jgi:hypothetical protein